MAHSGAKAAWSSVAGVSPAKATLYATWATMCYAAAMDADHFGDIVAPDLDFEHFVLSMPD